MGTLNDTAAAIAPLLGDGWAAGNGLDWSHMDTARLIGPNGAGLFLALKEGRIDIRGSLPDGWLKHTPGSYVTDAPRNPHITVSAAKTPEQIARDIARRVLPEYTRYLDATRVRRDSSNAHDVLVQSVGDAIIAAAAPCEARWVRSSGRDSDQPTTLDIGGYGKGIHGDARIMGDSVQFDRLEMSHADAVEFMRWIAKRSR